VPKLWSETIKSHRDSVHDALLDATAQLIAEHGLMSVTMSQVAETTGIGRATLYRYFADLESILVAWHERQIGAHVAELTAIRDRSQDPRTRLEAVLKAFAMIAHARHDSDIAAVLHRANHMTAAQLQLTELVQGLIIEAAAAGTVRSDVDASELASYCLHALSGASTLSSNAALQRLVTLTIAGLSPP
jgi:AcrR family transcriptional regulator